MILYVHRASSLDLAILAYFKSFCEHLVRFHNGGEFSKFVILCQGMVWVTNLAQRYLACYA